MSFDKGVSLLENISLMSTVHYLSTHSKILMTPNFKVVYLKLEMWIMR